MRVRVKAVVAVVTVVAFLGAGVVPSSPASAATRLPVPYNFGAGVIATLLHPGAPPPGSNNWACRPSAAHPHPVILVHGTFANMTDSWQAASPLLANAGYCVFALNYGGAPGSQLQGYRRIEDSAAQLGAFVDRVRAATGVSKVDLVGHSQGGMMPRHYLRFLGGAGKVRTLVGLSPSNHGTDFFGLAALLPLFPGGSSFLTSLCAACTQQTAGSAFLSNLNSGGDTVAGVNYTVIQTRYDEVVTPHTSAFLSGPRVTNILLQNRCLLDFSDHLGIIYDRIALRLVLNALDPASAVRPPCSLVLPAVGG